MNNCNHVESLKNTKESSSYTLLYAYYVVCSAPGSSKKETLKTSCYVCKRSGVPARLHACLSCVFIGCLKDHFEKHEEKHKFAMDLFHGAIYCFKCKDYTYDPIDLIKEPTTWIASEEDRILFKKHIPAKMNQSLVGLRGLQNLGLTCYINCIIQVFASTPMMRNYFFSGRHLCSPKEKDCQACLLSEIYQELYSGKQYPLELIKLVYDVWKRHETFRKSDAMDAHEFYIFYLNDLHECCKKEKVLTCDPDYMVKVPCDLDTVKTDVPTCDPEYMGKIPCDMDTVKTADSEPCRCVIHQIFSGNYQNIKSCSKCGILTSLDQESWNITLPHWDHDGKVELVDCIKKCMQGTEYADQTQKHKCSICEEGILRDQLFFKVLPNVLCFHFGMHAKVTFPEDLDMSLYTPETARSEILSANRANSFEKCHSSKNMYILYAVVCHKKINNAGHYYTYVRRGEKKWYKCDDDKIYSVEFEEVSQCPGTLVFYIKEVLEYEQSSHGLNMDEQKDKQLTTNCKISFK